MAQQEPWVSVWVILKDKLETFAIKKIPINYWASSKLNTGEKAEIFILPLQEALEFLPAG